MITGIFDFNYNVSHMERAVHFYHDALGMKIERRGENWTTLGCDGIHVGLHWTGGDKVKTVPADEHGAMAGGTLTLKSSDIAADRSLLEGMGAAIVNEREEAWGDLLTFEDPDGNVLQLMHPKH
jgi:catechol 2,3-dioxygenase-like lactoylglutathione lyase family enzyme